MNRDFIIVFVFSTLLGIRSSAAAETITVTIDPEKRHQVMDGFGASGAWWPSWVGDYPREKQEQLLDLLFTAERGIALSIYRYNIPAGGGAEIRRPERATAKIETSPRNYDLLADRKALEILRGVRKRGVERFVLFANSPPGRLTRNGLASGGEKGGSNFRPGAEAEFAKYLIDVATKIRDEYDLPHVAVAPINEPQWKWGERRRTQEGCHYTPTEAAAVIRATIEEAERRKTGLRVEAPESGAWKETMPYAAAMFADPVIDRHIQDLAIHSYWTDQPTRRRAAEALREKFPSKRIAMTEYCQMKTGHDLGIDSAIEMAEVIHDDLTVGGVISWQWWLGVAAGGYKDGLIYAHPKTQNIEPTKRLWALGNWSRFVRPGFRRVGLELKGDDGVKATAFSSDDGKRVACVMINATKQPVTVSIAVAGRARAKLSQFVTDETRDLAKVEPQGGDDIVLSPRSVSTLVIE
jgi:O-glycosyl hydrolase